MREPFCTTSSSFQVTLFIIRFRPVEQEHRQIPTASFSCWCLLLTHLGRVCDRGALCRDPARLALERVDGVTRERAPAADLASLGELAQPQHERHGELGRRRTTIDEAAVSSRVASGSQRGTHGNLLCATTRQESTSESDADSSGGDSLSLSLSLWRGHAVHSACATHTTLSVCATLANATRTRTRRERDTTRTRCDATQTRT